MGKIEHIQKSIEELSPKEVAKLRIWVEELEGRLFDEAIERDAKAGKLDKIIAEVKARHAAGQREKL